MTWQFLLRFERIFFVIGLLYFLSFLAYSEAFIGKSFNKDPMAAAGFGLVLSGVAIAWLVQRQFPYRVGLMIRSGAISSIEMDEAAFIAELERYATRAFFIIFLTMTPLFVGGVLSVDSNELGKPHLITGGVIGAGLIAMRFAYGVATGWASSRLVRSEVSITLAPNHPDRSAGFGHLGYFYFDQALVLLLPAAFMMFWLVYVGVNLNKLEEKEIFNLVVAHAEDQRSFSYRPPVTPPEFVEEYVVCPHKNSPITECRADERLFIWQDPFLLLIGFNLIIFLLSWGWPSWRIYRRMKTSRATDVDPEIDRLESVVAAARRTMRTESGGIDQKAFAALDDDVERLAILRSCPVFPIPIWTAVTAVVSNVSALFGLIGANFL